MPRARTLTVTRRGFFAQDLELFDDQRPVAEIAFASMGDAAELHVGGVTYEARRKGWISPAFVLERDGAELARAECEGFWRRTYEIHRGSTVLSLTRKGMFRADFVLSAGDVEVGSVSREGAWKPTTVATFSTELDPVLQTFIVWLVSVLWRSEATAATVTATG
jgi:hypothetical protein